MSIVPPRIVCCGFTPCIQRILEFDRLEKGAVNRAGRVTIGIGGKGANTARMVNQLGGSALLVGFAGGTNGSLLEQMLENEGVAFRTVYAAGETRICQTLIESGNPDVTELVEEMPPVGDEEWRAMLELFGSLELENTVVSISGRLPAGAPGDAYAAIAAIVSEGGGRILIDAPGEPLLRVLDHKPYMVKINDVELMETIPGEDIVDAGRRLVDRGARSVLITRGAESAFYIDEVQTLEIFPPKIHAINPVGSGDAVTAGIAVGLSMGKTLQEVLIDGMACGAANALNRLSGLIRTEDVQRLCTEVRIEPAR